MPQLQQAFLASFPWPLAEVTLFLFLCEAEAEIVAQRAVLSFSIPCVAGKSDEEKKGREYLISDPNNGGHAA